MTFYEISMKLEKKKKSKKGYLCYPVNKYVFKVKPLFRDFACTETFVGMNLLKVL